MLKSCILHTTNPPNKNPSPTCMPKFPQASIGWQHLLSKWDSPAGAHSKAKAGFSCTTRGSEWKTRSCATITGGSSPFLPALSLCCACCHTHSWFLQCQAIPHISSLWHLTTHEHSPCSDRLLHSFSPSLSQLVAAFGCTVYQKCCFSFWTASWKQHKHPLESSTVPPPPLLNSPKQCSHSLQHIHHWVKEIPPTNAIKCLPEGNIISTCSTNIIKKTQTTHRTNSDMVGGLQDPACICSAWITKKRGIFFAHRTERESWSNPRLMRCCRAPSNIQLHAGMWIFKSLQPSWAGIMNSSSSDSSLLPPEGNTSCRGKTQGWRVPMRSKWPPVPREKVLLHSLLDKTIPTSLTASHKVLLGLRGITSFSPRGSFLSFNRKRRIKFLQRTGPGGKSSFCFSTGSFLKTSAQRHSAC